jgi:hypothetical protein
LCCC